MNQGYQSSLHQQNRVGKNRLFTCHQMVGPIDEKYYCRGKEYGYCDRVSLFVLSFVWYTLLMRSKTTTHLLLFNLNSVPAHVSAMRATWVIRAKVATHRTFSTVDYVIPRLCVPMIALMPESVIISLECVYAVIIEKATIALFRNARPFMSFAPLATTANAWSVNKDGV